MRWEIDKYAPPTKRQVSVGKWRAGPWTTRPCAMILYVYEIPRETVTQKTEEIVENERKEGTGPTDGREG